MKPTDRAQGQVFLVKKLCRSKSGQRALVVQRLQRAYVISRYIENPMLIGGKKFDTAYVLVTQYRPLNLYVPRWFRALCGTKYSTDLSQLGNMFIHLTNVAVQKRNDSYSKLHGGKWGINQLKLYLEATTASSARKIFQDITSIVVHSLKAVQNVMINDRHYSSATATTLF